jgi:hypothetical protein
VHVPRARPAGSRRRQAAVWVRFGRWTHAGPKPPSSRARPKLLPWPTWTSPRDHPGPRPPRTRRVQIYLSALSQARRTPRSRCSARRIARSTCWECSQTRRRSCGWRRPRWLEWVKTLVGRWQGLKDVGCPGQKPCLTATCHGSRFDSRGEICLMLKATYLRTGETITRTIEI